VDGTGRGSCSFGNEGTSSGASDVDNCFIIRKLLDSVLKILRCPFVKFKHTRTHTGLFSRKVACTKYEVSFFVEWMDFSSGVAVSGSAVCE
jgi:hypothetical protein